MGFGGGRGMRRNGFKGGGGGQFKKMKEKRGSGKIKLGWKRFSIDEKFFWFIHEI